MTPTSSPALSHSDSWQVHKFGGTSLADADCIRRAADLATADATNRTALAEAERLGYTEPDPEEDLQGLDMHRKALILARHMGITPVDVTPEPLSNDDAYWDRARVVAASQRRVLVPRGLSFGVDALPAAHPLANVKAGDNAVVFTTRRYRERPLVVAGPGAGPDVTAAAVFADLCTVISLVGGRR